MYTTFHAILVVIESGNHNEVITMRKPMNRHMNKPMQKSLMKLLTLAFTLCLIMLFTAGCGGQDSNSDQGSAQAPDDAYAAIVTDEDNAPVEGVVLQLCSDIACEQQTTDETGLAVFTSEPGIYKLKIYKVPDGYAEDHTEYEVADDYDLIQLILKAD